MKHLTTGVSSGVYCFESVPHPTMHADQVRGLIVVNKGRCACGNETLNRAKRCGVCITAERRAEKFLFVREAGVDVVVDAQPAVERKVHKRRVIF